MLSERFMLIFVPGGCLLVILGTEISLINSLDSLSLTLDVYVLVTYWYRSIVQHRLLYNGVAVFDESTLRTR